ncbi:MAG: hypothetical protein KC561_09570 [Myxococcales bacterium]|nr:hypothetical protein [Myxococcales bacterium]
MPVLSGTLRYWNEGGETTEVRLDRVEFAFVDTYEPSLIVEEVYRAKVGELSLRFGEFDGFAKGYTIAVAGIEHASLSDWTDHTYPSSPRPDFTDTLTLSVSGAK